MERVNRLSFRLYAHNDGIYDEETSWDYEDPIEAIVDEKYEEFDTRELIEIDNEVWCQINGFPDYYISNLGRVWSCYFNKIIRPYFDMTGSKVNKRYYKYKLVNSFTGRQHSCYMHRLIAEHFIYNPKKDQIVRHLDDDSTNNSIENLPWGSQKDNANDFMRNGGYNKRCDPPRKHVKARNIYTNEVIIFNSMWSAARFLNYSYQNFQFLLNKKKNKVAGEWLVEEYYGK